MKQILITLVAVVLGITAMSSYAEDDHKQQQAAKQESDEGKNNRWVADERRVSQVEEGKRDSAQIRQEMMPDESNEESTRKADPNRPGGFLCCKTRCMPC